MGRAPLDPGNACGHQADARGDQVPGC
jgi:hypothetical protein